MPEAQTLFSQSPLIPAQTPILQPGARFFRIIDALNWLDSSAITSSLQQQVITQTGQIVSTQGDVTTLQTDVTTLQGQVSALQTSIGQIAGEIAALQTQVTAIRNWINTYGASLGGTPI